MDNRLFVRATAQKWYAKIIKNWKFNTKLHSFIQNIAIMSTKLFFHTPQYAHQGITQQLNNLL